jgi:hypothetical protein
MCSHHDMADVMLLARVVLEHFRLQGPAFWPTAANVADVSGRCVKQPIKVTLFAHEMEPELPLRAEILKNNPVRGGHMHLFDDPNAKPDPFCSMEITVGGREVFSLFWGEACCHAWMSPGPWQPDIIRWATKHQDPIRLANLNLVRHLLGRLRRDGYMQDRYPRVAALCFDDYGFGGELEIWLSRPEGLTDPFWPFSVPEDAEPEHENKCLLHVMFGRRSLLDCSWSVGEEGWRARVYSDLGHFHEPLLRWAQSL